VKPVPQAPAEGVKSGFMLTPIALWGIALVPDWLLFAYGLTLTVIALVALSRAAHLVRERER
jgi:hypothetical protein